MLSEEAMRTGYKDDIAMSATTHQLLLNNLCHVGKLIVEPQLDPVHAGG